MRGAFTQHIFSYLNKKVFFTSLRQTKFKHMAFLIGYFPQIFENTNIELYACQVRAKNPFYSFLLKKSDRWEYFRAHLCQSVTIHFRILIDLILLSEISFEWREIFIIHDRNEIFEILLSSSIRGFKRSNDPNYRKSFCKTSIIHLN